MPSGRRRGPDVDPALPDDITGRELDRDVRGALRTLPDELAELVARHLVAAGQAVDVDPEQAYRHAMAAQRRAARVAAVREAAGVAAYRTGRYIEALRELRAARRMSGSDEHLPMIADCERGLGRAERALDIAGSPAASRLNRAGQIELRIVASGARRDLGQIDASLVTLQVEELRSGHLHPWSARLFYAYADVLLALGRQEEAGQWFARSAEADTVGETDAAERLAELDGVVFVETLNEE